MKDFNTILDGILSEEAIGELMLVKNALEEKYELINEKDRIIRDLVQKNSTMEERLAQLEKMGTDAEAQNEEIQEVSYWKGAESVIRDIVSVLIQYERLKKNMKIEEGLDEKILQCLKKNYGLQRIDEQPESINPKIHNVIEVVDRDEANDTEKIVVLSSGYKLKGQLLFPVKLRVITGGKEDSRSGKGKRPKVHATGSSDEGGRSTHLDPKGAA